MSEEATTTAAQPSVEGQTTTDEVKVDMSQFYSKAYNEGKGKSAKDVLGTLNELGIETDDLSEGLTILKEKFKATSEKKPKKEENNAEVDQLREKLQQFEKEKNDLQEAIRAQNLRGKINDQKSVVKDKLENEGELTIGIDKIQALFEMEYTYQEQDGQLYAIKSDGSPDLDDSGNRKSLASSMADFIRQENLINPSKQGAGGGTGGVGASSGKSSKSEWSRLLNSKGTHAQEQAAIMWNTAKQTGWAE